MLQLDTSHEMAGRVYSANGLCPTITCGGGQKEPKIMEDFYKNRQNRMYEETAPTIRANRQGLKVVEPKLIKEMQLDNTHEQSGRVYNTNGIAPTIMSNSHGKTDGGYTATKIMIPEATKQGYANDIGVVIGNTQKNAYIGTTEDPSPTLTSAMGQGGGHIPMIVNNARIRKLTPKETWRLMGFTDDDFEKASKVNNNSQLYKQAGNSIVVQVLEAIFKQMKRRK